MKFGKQMAQMVALSDAEWAPFWISYKALKKRIKDLQAGRNRTVSEAEAAEAEAAGGKCGGTGACCVDRPPTAKDLACSAGEVAFFKTIRAEIAKATDFYLGMEQQMSARKRRIRLGIHYLQQPTAVLEDDAWTRMRQACVALYKDLLLLEHFAVINYCACAKALKKHDKTVGINVRARFMRNVVHHQPFTHYPRLLEMLQEMEATFQELNVIQGESARPLEAEERLFLDAIRGLNQQASSMQREEKADLGGVSAASDSDDAAAHGKGAAAAATSASEASASAAAAMPKSGGKEAQEE